MVKEAEQAKKTEKRAEKRRKKKEKQKSSKRSKSESRESSVVPAQASTPDEDGMQPKPSEEVAPESKPDEQLLSKLVSAVRQYERTAEDPCIVDPVEGKDEKSEPAPKIAKRPAGLVIIDDG